MGTRMMRGMVAAPHPAAAAAGMEMLNAGGTAVDAAVASAFTLTVVNPAMTGVAGYGGCMIIYLADRGAIAAVDYNCRAPQAAGDGMFAVREDGAGGFTVEDAANVVGVLAIDVPGTVAGLLLALERFGSLPLDAVLRPAIAAARDGFVVDAWTASKINEMLVPYAHRFPDTLRLFSVNGRPPLPGETLKTPELAVLLDAIARGGADVFYRGEIARAIVDAVQRAGGILTLEDLAGYEAREVAPVRCQYRGHEVWTLPLPAGGLTLLQMLRVLEGFDARSGEEADVVHLLIEVSKVCWRERLTRHGDPGIVPVDQAREMGDALVRALRAEVAAGLDAPGPGVVIAPDPIMGTVHLCTADHRGNIVSLTQTHGGSFGSLLSVPEIGLTLGHGLSRFDPRPGRPNSVGPGKRPLHNMAPTLVCEGGRPALAIGAAGGRTILSNLCHAIVRLIDRGEPLEILNSGTRYHVETAEPVRVEETGAALAEGLRRRGHQVQLRPRFGALQAIRCGPEPGVLHGVADSRRAGMVLWA